MKPSVYTAGLMRLLLNEGDRVDDPRDKGGRTAFGVTQRRYDAYRSGKRLPKRDVWLISPLETMEIYQTYWEICGAPQWESKGWYKVAVFLFDTVVNGGLASVIQRTLQRPVTGKLTPDLLVALQMLIEKNGEDTVLGQLATARKNRFDDLAAKDPAQERFLKGWHNRVDSLVAYLNK